MNIVAYATLLLNSCMVQPHTSYRLISPSVSLDQHHPYVNAGLFSRSYSPTM